MDLIGSLVVGLSSGGLFAAFGVLLTLMASLTRVVNFAAVAVGVFGAYLSIRLVPTGAPAFLAPIAATIIGGVLSIVLGWVITRWLGESSTAARSAVTVATLLGLISLSALAFGTRPQPLPPLAVGPLVTFGTIAVTKVGVLMLALAVAVAVAAHLVLTRTPVGIRLRAIADRQVTSELVGINVKRDQRMVWGIAGALSGLFISIVGNAQAGSAASMIVLLIPAAAAALIGAFRSLVLTIVGGLLVGAVQGVLTSLPAVALARDWVPIVVIVVFLLVNQRKEVWDAAR